MIILLIIFLLVPVYADAATYWVSRGNGGTSGQGQHCVASSTQPGNLDTQTSGTINEGIACLSSGDTLYILAGDYRTGAGAGQGPWSRKSTPTTCRDTVCVPNGISASQHTVISAAPGAERQVYLGGAAAGGNVIANFEGYVKWITVKGFVLDGSAPSLSNTVAGECAPPFDCVNVGLGDPWVTEMLIENNEIFGSVKSGLHGFDRSTIRGNYIHNNGTDTRLDHQIYTGGRDMIIENNEISNSSCYGIQVFNQNAPYPTNAIVRGNLTHDNPCGGIVVWNTEAGSNGIASRIYNNVSYSDGAGINIGYVFSGSTYVYNNTIYATNGTSGNAGIQVTSCITGADLKNNLMVSTPGIVSAPIECTPEFTQSFNINTGTNPFVNPSARNFQLNSGSVPINAGTALTSLAGANYALDANNITRPQGSLWDIGACEWFSGAPVCPSLQAVPVTQPPMVNIVGPTSQLTYTSVADTIVISGTATGGDGTLSTVTCANDRGGSCTINGTTNWSTSVINLQSGLNVITITATGSTGSGTDTLTVNHPTSNILTVHPSNPRYFTNLSGKAILMMGHQIFWDIQDHEYGVPATYGNQPTLDHTGFYIPFINARKINYVRNWTLFSTGSPVPANVNTTPMPWVRSGTCCAADGGNKFQLNTFNQVFFDRVRQRVIDLGKAGVFTTVNLGSDSFQFDGARFPFNMFKASNNVNGVDADTNSDGWAVEWWMSPTSTMLSYQQAYMQKMIDTLNDLDNVIWEVGNEMGSWTWQENMIAAIKAYEATKAKQHLVMVSWGGFSGPDWQFTGVATNTMVASQADVVGVGDDFGTIQTDPVVNNYGKPAFVDMDHINGFNNSRQVPWKLFTRGYNFTLYDHPFEVPESEDSVWDNTRYNVGAIANYANVRFTDLASMQPSTGASSTGYALVSGGQAYMVYQPNHASFQLQVAQGQYNAEWFNPVTAAVDSSVPFSATTTSTYTFTPPANLTQDAVLYLYQSTVAPPSLVITTPTSSPTYITANPTITLAGNAFCDDGVKTVTWTRTVGTSPQVVDSGTASGTINWSIANSAMAGYRINYFNVTSTCQGGLTVTKQIAVRANGPDAAVLLLPLNENTGTTATDLSGFGNNLSFGGAGTIWVDGKFGKALNFNGNGYGVIPDADSLDLSILTMAAWIKPAVTLTDWASVMVKNYRYFMYAAQANYCPTSTGPLVGVTEQINSVICVSNTIQPNIWTHIAMTYDGTTVTAYINGSVVETLPASELLTETSGTFEVAASMFGEYFNGAIDEIQVYNKAAPQAFGANDTSCADMTIATLSIQRIMNCPTPSAVLVTPGLVFGPDTNIRFGPDADVRFGTQ